MSEQASMQDHPAASSRPSTELRTTQDGAAQPARILVLAALCVGVAALAGAAFVLSYSGIHAVAMQAGISSQHARAYPILIDAMLVIALLAVLGLRGAGLPSRILSWLALLCVLAVAAGADVMHATGRVLRHTAAAATAAALPWALVFIAFVLLLAVLRHARLRRQASVAQRTPLAADAGPAYVEQPIPPPPPSLPMRTPRAWDSASIVPGFSARLVSSAAAGAAAGAARQPGPPPAEPRDDEPAEADRDEADAILGLAGADTSAREGGDADDPRADAAPEDSPPTEPDAPAEPDDPPAADADADAVPDDSAAEPDDPPAADADADAVPADAGSVETVSVPDEGDDPGTPDPAASDQGADDDADNMPVFHRMWSTPTPPDS